MIIFNLTASSFQTDFIFNTAMVFVEYSTLYWEVVIIILKPWSKTLGQGASEKSAPLPRNN